MPDLDDVTYERVTSLCEQGDGLAHEQRYDEAIRCYQAAWEWLPEQRHSWNVALWITMVVGDAHFLSSRFADARASFTLAMLLGGTENPFVHLRLGESFFELGRH